jgi:hypothetical protein
MSVPSTPIPTTPTQNTKDREKDRDRDKDREKDKEREREREREKERDKDKDKERDKDKDCSLLSPPALNCLPVLPLRITQKGSGPSSQGPLGPVTPGLESPKQFKDEIFFWKSVPSKIISENTEIIGLLPESSTQGTLPYTDHFTAPISARYTSLNNKALRKHSLNSNTNTNFNSSSNPDVLILNTKQNKHQNQS